MFAGHALRWTTSVTSLRIAFGVAVVQHNFIIRVGHHVFPLRNGDVVAIQCRYRLLRIAARRRIKIRVIRVVVIRIGIIIIIDWLIKIGIGGKHKWIGVRHSRHRAPAGRVILQANRIRLRTVKYQLPFGQNARLIDAPAAAVYNLQRPTSFRLLAPEMHAEERPVVEVAFDNVTRPFEQQGARGAHRRCEQNTEITAREKS